MSDASHDRFKGPYTAAQVAMVSGMAKAVLADFVKRGIVTPSVHRGTGTGDPHMFSSGDLLALCVLELLRPKNRMAPFLKRLFELFAATPQETIESFHEIPFMLVSTDTKGIVSLQKGDDPRSMVGSDWGHMAFLLNPKAIWMELMTGRTTLALLDRDQSPLPSGHFAWTQERRDRVAKVRAERVAAAEARERKLAERCERLRSGGKPKRARKEGGRS
jgi:hypothetical protein